MDIAEALQTVAMSVWLPGRSTASVVADVQSRPTYIAPSKPLGVAAGLAGGIRLRAVDALHALSFATRPLYQDDVFDQYLQWGLLRYLGFFDLAGPSTSPRLKLSEPGGRIIGNQRRVTSEEMGIGFGAVLARSWMQSSSASIGGINIVDVDVALRSGFLFAAGVRQRVRSVADRRPDYLIIANDLEDPTRYSVRVLECKGTSSPSYAVTQLSTALEQLDGMSVGGRVPAGLAVSTVTSTQGISYVAIDPDDQNERSYRITSDTVRRARDFDLVRRERDVSAQELISASVAGAWAMLADFAGNLTALERWSPAVMRRGLNRRSRGRRLIETPYGQAVGTSAAFGFQGRRLTVSYAVSRSIDQQLNEGSAEAVAESQAEFSRLLMEAHQTDADRFRVKRPQAGHIDAFEALADEGQSTGSNEDSVFSATSNGSILVLALE